MRANHLLERNMRGLFVLIAVSIALPSMAGAQSNPLSLQDKYAAKYGTTPLKTTPATPVPDFHSAAAKFQPGAKDLPAQPTGSQSTDQAAVTATKTTVAPAVDPPQPPKSDGRFHLSKFGKHLFTAVDALGSIGAPDTPAVDGVRGASQAEAAMPTPTGGGDLQPAPVAPQPAYSIPGQAYSAPTATPAAAPASATPLYQAPTPNAQVIKTGP